MWSEDILKVVLQDCASATTLPGLYSVDILPKQIEYSAVYIVNLIWSTLPGTHWTAMDTDQHRWGHYCDCFGNEPPKATVKFSKRNYKLYRVNETQVQHNNSIRFGILYKVYCIYLFQCSWKGIMSFFILRIIRKMGIL